MLDVLGIILIIVFGLMITMAIICNTQNESYGVAAITTGAILILVSIFSGIDNSNPKAIDVYRNRTTLEITYKDGVPIDTVVVFKKK